MKFNWMLSLSDVLLLVGLFQPAMAQSAPAPVFEPVLSDIRQQLPANLQMRLPSALPSVPKPLYASVEADDTGLRVYLSPDSSCQGSFQPDCTTVGAAAVLTASAYDRWRSQYPERLEPLSLAGGITGYYLRIDVGQGELQYIGWQQDGFGYVVGSVAQGLSKQVLVEMAGSMIAASPIQ